MSEVQDNEQQEEEEPGPYYRGRDNVMTAADHDRVGNHSWDDSPDDL